MVAYRPEDNSSGRICSSDDRKPVESGPRSCVTGSQMFLGVDVVGKRADG